MEPCRPEFLPDPSLDRPAMEALQADIAATARFDDDPDLGSVAGTVVAGVDQAFLDETAISAIVAMADGEVVERVAVEASLEFPYVPGFLSFREGGPIIAAFRDLSVEPDLVLFDGNGRLHYRQAGLATHMGVVFDRPTIGVAKSLLCGTPQAPLDTLPAGARVAIEPDDDVRGDPGTILGYALQTRQWAAEDRHINPVYVSPGHRLSAPTAADHVEALCEGYKLPEPIRRADRFAAATKAERR